MSWQKDLQRPRRRLKIVAPIISRNYPRPVPGPKPFMDRGLLNIAVQAYANANDIDYEDAHARLKRGPGPEES